MKKFGYLLVLSDLPDIKDDSIKFLENIECNNSIEFDEIKVLFYYAKNKDEFENLTRCKVSEFEKRENLSSEEASTYSACRDLSIAFTYVNIFCRLPQEVKSWVEENLMNVDEENIYFTSLIK